MVVCIFNTMSKQIIFFVPHNQYSAGLFARLPFICSLSALLGLLLRFVR